MSGDADSSDRVTVKTYVSAEQREIWRDAASGLDMTMSEFVASMVQAGRSEFLHVQPETTQEGSEEPPREDATPRGGALEDRVLDVLENDGPLEWDELVDEFLGDFESELDDALASLQEENRLHYSGRNGGYKLNGETHE